MFKDRYMKIVLTVIALSLAILAAGSLLHFSSTPAQAQRPYNTVKTDGPAVDVLLIRDIPIDNLKDVYVLGDTKTFIVKKSSGISVYRVDYIERKK